MRVEVWDSQKNHYDLDIEESASPQDFKNLFHESHYKDIDNYKLIYKGREIKNDKKFSDYSITEGSKITILESKLKKPEETKDACNFKFPQFTCHNQQNAQISSEINFPKPIVSRSQILQADIKPLERQYIDFTRQITDEKLCQLIMMGFDPELSSQALIQSNGNLDDSIAILLTQNEPNSARIPIEPKLNIAEVMNGLVNDCMETQESQLIVWQITNNPNQCEQIINSQIADPGLKKFLLDNKKLFFEACKKRVIFANENGQRNRIEEIKVEPVRVQYYSRTEGGEKFGSVRTYEGMGGIGNIEEGDDIGIGGTRIKSSQNGLRGSRTEGIDGIINGETNKIQKKTEEKDKDHSFSQSDSFSSDSDVE